MHGRMKTASGNFSRLPHFQMEYVPSTDSDERWRSDTRGWCKGWNKVGPHFFRAFSIWHNVKRTTDRFLASMFCFSSTAFHVAIDVSTAVYFNTVQFAEPIWILQGTSYKFLRRTMSLLTMRSLWRIWVYLDREVIKLVYWKDRARTLEETGGLFMSIVHLHIGCEVIEPIHNSRSFVLIILFHSCPWIQEHNLLVCLPKNSRWTIKQQKARRKRIQMMYQ